MAMNKGLVMASGVAGGGRLQAVVGLRNLSVVRSLVSPFVYRSVSVYNRRLFRPSIAMASSSATAQSEDTRDSDGAGFDLFSLIQAHQEKAIQLTPVEQVRTLLSYGSRGMLSTFSKAHEGYPSGSMVDYACDADGSPILAVSSLAVHTKDILANPKCSLLVTRNPEDRTDLIVTIHGDAISVPEKDRDAARTAYLAKHPNAFWVDFGDFKFLRIEPKVVRYVSGVATATLGSGEFSNEEYSSAQPDSIHKFSKPIASHMNKDHEDETKLIVHHLTSIPVDRALILDLDSLGFNVKAGYKGENFKLRIPFPRQAADRKDVKNLIVEMLEGARSQGN